MQSVGTNKLTVARDRNADAVQIFQAQGFLGDYNGDVVALHESNQKIDPESLPRSHDGEYVRWARNISPIRQPVVCSHLGCTYHAEQECWLDNHLLPKCGKTKFYCFLHYAYDEHLRRHQAGKLSAKTRVVNLMRRMYPGLTPEQSTQIYEHAWDPRAYRVGRDSSVKIKSRIFLAVQAWVRHNATDYDSLFEGGFYPEQQYEARDCVRSQVARCLHALRHGEAIVLNTDCDEPEEIFNNIRYEYDYATKRYTAIEQKVAV